MLLAIIYPSYFIPLAYTSRENATFHTELARLSDADWNLSFQKLQNILRTNGQYKKKTETFNQG